ncbi:ORF13 [Sulfolobus spindle-shaped virus 3]|nr:ORF13 [Sulfolobus spindle-shaped virus 3]
MLIHAGLNTHSNRISVKKLKEGDNNSAVAQKTEFHGNCCSQKIQSDAACSMQLLYAAIKEGVLLYAAKGITYFPFTLVRYSLKL